MHVSLCTLALGPYPNCRVGGAIALYFANQFSNSLLSSLHLITCTGNLSEGYKIFWNDTIYLPCSKKEFEEMGV